MIDRTVLRQSRMLLLWRTKDPRWRRSRSTRILLYRPRYRWWAQSGRIGRCRSELHFLQVSPETFTRLETITKYWYVGQSVMTKVTWSPTPLRRWSKSLRDSRIINWLAVRVTKH